MGTCTARAADSRPDTVLALLALAYFGNHYVYDSISPVADLLARQRSISDSPAAS